MADAEPTPTAQTPPAAPRGSARIGMRGGIGLARSRALGEKKAEQERKLSRQTWRSIIIGVGVGVVLYVALRVVAFGR